MIIVAVISFIAVLGVLVLVHEFGHFVAAKIFGVRVEEFGLGFPPRLAGWKKGETTYSVNWIPVGGFVKIQGVLGGNVTDMTADSQPNRSFMNKPRWQRLLILCAGIVMNCVLSTVLFAGSYIAGAPVALEAVPAGAIISDRGITVINLAANTPAATAGLQISDQISAIDGQTVTTVAELRDALHTKQAGDEVTLTIQRAAATLTITTSLIALEGDTAAIGIGAYFVETGTMRLPWWLALREGARQTSQLFFGIFLAIGQAISSLVTQQPVAGQISGPLGIASLTYQATQLGWTYVIQFAAMLSVNLAVFNLLPIPGLDGGRLAFLLVEWVRRRPVNEKIEGIVHNIGYLLLLFLIMVVTIKDIMNLF